MIFFECIAHNDYGFWAAKSGDGIQPYK